VRSLLVFFGLISGELGLSLFGCDIVLNGEVLDFDGDILFADEVDVDGDILFDGEVWNLGGEMLEAEIRVEFVRRLSVGETRGFGMRLFSNSISFDFLVLKTCDSSPPLALADQPTVR